MKCTHTRLAGIHTLTNVNAMLSVHYRQILLSLKMLRDTFAGLNFFATSIFGPKTKKIRFVWKIQASSLLVLNPKISHATKLIFSNITKHNNNHGTNKLESGKGVKLYEIDQNDDFDFLFAYSAVNQGHWHPNIINALIAQSQKLNLTSRAFHNNLVESIMLDDEEQNSSSCGGGCASGKYCRCPWKESRFAHTCIQCKKPVHSFCFGFNEEGGKSKCALCVFPNRVCQYSMQLDPGSGPSSVGDTSLVLDDSSELVLSILNEESGTYKMNIEHSRGDNNDSNTFDEQQSVHSEESDPNSDSPDLLLVNVMSAQDGNLSFEINAEVVTATTKSMEQDNLNKIELVLDDDDSNDEDKENTQVKKFEDMNEDELKNEFLKRNMKVGRITKKSTFITRLTKYERANEKKK